MGASGRQPGKKYSADSAAGPSEMADSAADTVCEKKKQRTDKTIEPVAFHSTPALLWEELLNVAGAHNPTPKMVCELVAADDTLAYICLQKQIPYLGICFNETHRDLLRTRLAQRVFQAMRDPDNLFASMTKQEAAELNKCFEAGSADVEEDDDDDPEDSLSNKRGKRTLSTLAAGTPKCHTDYMHMLYDMC